MPNSAGALCGITEASYCHDVAASPRFNRVMRRRNVLVYNLASIGADSAFRPLSSVSEGRSNLIRRSIAANEIEELRDFNILFVANGLE
jgi:hypothetical protein